jgi:hypothetical protein
MTLRYFPDKSPEDLAELTETVSRILKDRELKRFPAEFILEAWYGPQHTVRVLEPRHDHIWPGWMMLLLAGMPEGSKQYKFHPHIACKDKGLRAVVVAVSLMCKKTEIARWDLT